MSLHLATIVLAYHFMTPALTAPYDPISLVRRNASQTSPPITSIIRSANGTDVTSSFRTLVYYQADTVSPKSNLTDRQTASIRQITHCRSPFAEFLGSICSHSRGSEMSILDYTVQCREQSRPRYALMMAYDLAGMPNPEPRYYNEAGSCNEHEICVNSMPHERQEVPIATCVDTEKFLEDPRRSEQIHASAQRQGSSTGQFIGDSLRSIAAKKVGIVVSGQDASMPIELDSLEVDVGAESDGSKVQQQTCRDCFGLRTKMAATDADFVKIEATLMATAAMAGIVWVSVFAG